MSKYIDRLTIIECKKVIHDQSHQGGMRKVTHNVCMTAMMTFFTLIWISNATNEKKCNGGYYECKQGKQFGLIICINELLPFILEKTIFPKVIAPRQKHCGKSFELQLKLLGGYDCHLAE